MVQISKVSGHDDFQDSQKFRKTDVEPCPRLVESYVFGICYLTVSGHSHASLHHVAAQALDN